MYQITFGTDISKNTWIESLHAIVGDTVKNNGGIMVVNNQNGRSSLSVALNSAHKKMKSILKEKVIDMYLTTVKEEYLYQKIKNYSSNEFLIKIYIKILQAFNTVEESNILFEKVELFPNTALDGVYEFRLNKLKEKWNELVGLSIENKDLIQEDSSFTMLLKYMISCLPSKTDSVSIDYDGNNYILSTDNGNKVAKTKEAVIINLIELAPCKIFLSKNAGNTKLDESIFSIFDASLV